MTFMKTAAIATLAITAAFGSTMTAANAGKKHHHHHHHKFHKKHHGPVLIIGAPDYNYGCKRWLRLYKKTGKQRFLNRYYACVY